LQGLHQNLTAKKLQIKVGTTLNLEIILLTIWWPSQFVQFESNIESSPSAHLAFRLGAPI